MITLEQAKELKRGDWIYSVTAYNRKAQPLRAKLTSDPKVWKRRPDKVEIHARHGLYENLVIREYHLDGWVLTEEEAKDARC